MNLDVNTSLALMNATQPNVKSAAGDVTRALSEKDEKRIDAAAKDFEAMFIAQMMKPMFEGIETNKLFGGGKGEEIFRGFMIEEYGKLMAETGQLGIADTIKQEMIRMQSQADNGVI